MYVPAGHRFPDATGVAFASAWARHRCLQLYLVLEFSAVSLLLMGALLSPFRRSSRALCLMRCFVAHSCKNVESEVRATLFSSSVFELQFSSLDPLTKLSGPELQLSPLTPISTLSVTLEMSSSV